MPLCICVLLALLVSHESVLSLQPARSLQMSPDYTGSPFYPKELYCHMAFGSGMESKKRYGGTKKIDLQGFEEIEGTRRYLCSKYKNPKKRRNHNPKEKQRKTWKGESHHETNQTQTVCDAKKGGKEKGRDLFLRNNNNNNTNTTNSNSNNNNKNNKNSNSNNSNNCNNNNNNPLPPPPPQRQRIFRLYSYQGLDCKNRYTFVPTRRNERRQMRSVLHISHPLKDYWEFREQGKNCTQTAPPKRRLGKAKSLHPLIGLTWISWRIIAGLVAYMSTFNVSCLRPSAFSTAWWTIDKASISKFQRYEGIFPFHDLKSRTNWSLIREKTIENSWSVAASLSLSEHEAVCHVALSCQQKKDAFRNVAVYKSKSQGKLCIWWFCTSVCQFLTRLIALCLLLCPSVSRTGFATGRRPKGWRSSRNGGEIGSLTLILDLTISTRGKNAEDVLDDVGCGRCSLS